MYKNNHKNKQKVNYSGVTHVHKSGAKQVHKVALLFVLMLLMQRIHADVTSDAATYVTSITDFYALIPIPQDSGQASTNFTEFAHLALRIEPMIAFIKENASTTPSNEVLLAALSECEAANRNIQVMLTTIQSTQPLTTELNRNFGEMIQRIRDGLRRQREKVVELKGWVINKAAKEAAQQVLISLIDALIEANTRTEVAWRFKRDTLRMPVGVQPVPEPPVRGQPIRVQPIPVRDDMGALPVGGPAAGGPVRGPRSPLIRTGGSAPSAPSIALPPAPIARPVTGRPRIPTRPVTRKPASKPVSINNNLKYFF